MLVHTAKPQRHRMKPGTMTTIRGNRIGVRSLTVTRYTDRTADGLAVTVCRVETLFRGTLPNGCRYRVDFTVSGPGAHVYAAESLSTCELHTAETCVRAVWYY
jgi:hypothetical protein